MGRRWASKSVVEVSDSEVTGWSRSAELMGVHAVGRRPRGVPPCSRQVSRDNRTLRSATVASDARSGGSYRQLIVPRENPEVEHRVE